MLRGKYYISRLVKEPVPDKRPAIQNMVQLLLAMVSRAINDIDHAPKIKLENKKKINQGRSRSIYSFNYYMQLEFSKIKLSKYL